MDLEHLETIAAVFDALGGNGGLEALTGSKTSTVSMWKAAERFPSNTFIVITDALHAIGKTAPASLWGMKTPAERESAA